MSDRHMARAVGRTAEREPDTRPLQKQRWYCTETLDVARCGSCGSKFLDIRVLCFCSGDTYSMER